jgi:predicted O-linked N-acetylglucosamine transferase (SPINDLY family)
MQIVYSDETRLLLDPDFQELDNTANQRPDWFEFWPIRLFFEQNLLSEDDFYGFFSPKFFQKTGLRGYDVKLFLEKNYKDHDVIIFSPQPDMGAFFLNVFEQAETFDPGFMKVSQQALNSIGEICLLDQMIMDSRKIIFSNYFVARGTFWKKWLELTNKIFNLAENKKNDVGLALCQSTHYSDNAQIKVFLQERIASYLLTKNDDWRSIRYNPFDMAWSASALSHYPHEAVLSDALKIAYKETRDKKYLEGFYRIRNEFIKKQETNTSSESPVIRSPIETGVHSEGNGSLKLSIVVSEAEKFISENKHLEAVALYHDYLDQHDDENSFAGHYNLAVLYSQLGQLDSAVHHLEISIQDNPLFLMGYLTLGLVQEKRGNATKAIQSWQHAFQNLNEENADIKIVTSILNNIGRLSEILHQYDVAESSLSQSLTINREQPSVIHHLIHLRQKKCEWPIKGAVLQDVDLFNYASPLSILSLTDDPGHQLNCAKRVVSETVKEYSRIVPTNRRYGHQRIRIGYLSSDLSMHAVSLLTVELFEKHNRDKFEVYAFCWSKEDGTPFRQRVKNAFDHFHKVGHLSDEEIAQLITHLEIDILIDLHGLSANMRPNVIAQGPAPIQITWLGYPGTTAIPYLDYVVADHYIFPKKLEKYFTEKPLYLPRIFQVSDTQRVSGTIKSREYYGLPPDTFVFCAFNNTYKITPEIFDCWMDILVKAPDSVIWLLEDNKWSKENLIKEAEYRGITKGRLFFAGRIDPKEYLSRFSAADVFLDTHPYNAGTTANDALWSGLPILTLEGNTYVSRMAASLLNSLKLQSLIAKNIEDYKNIAVDLAHNTEKVKKISKTLQNMKAEGNLFSTIQFVSEFEEALTRLYYNTKL